jgi:nitroreductase
VEVFEAVRTVLAVRRYQPDRPVPPEVLQRILEAGRLTGSSRNGQPWHFILVEDRITLARLGTLAPTGPYLAQAAAAIVVAIERTSSAVSDASRAIQSMILTAWSEGVGSNWVTLRGADEVRPLLGLPDALAAFAVVALGYPAQPTGRGRKRRKPLAEIAHRGRFGQPFG